MDPSVEGTPERIGSYRVVRRLATGGTSDVLLARAEGPHGFERTVVLKLLLAQYRDDPSFERMFAREAGAYARLSHPAIVKLYDFFSAEGTLVIVLEYIDGLPLNRARALLRQSGVELDDRSSLFLASRIFAALAAAHAARDPETGEFAPVIHRDVNPSNVLVPWDGHAKIADFGIAKVSGVQGDTRAGYIKGTYGYMAPEQVRGETVTHRADVYAAALVLWELLTKRKAIQRGALPEMEVLRAMADPQLPSLDMLRPDLPAPLRSALKRALEPAADRRAIFADELVAVLRSSADLELGRVILSDAMMQLRPSPMPEDLAKTISLTPSQESIDVERKAAASDTFTDPTMADTLHASAVADATIITAGPAMTMPLARPPMDPPAPVAPRPVHHATTRTAMGLGRTIAMSNAPARPPSVAPPPPPPPPPAAQAVLPQFAPAFATPPPLSWRPPPPPPLAAAAARHPRAAVRRDAPALRDAVVPAGPRRERRSGRHRKPPARPSPRLDRNVRRDGGRVGDDPRPRRGAALSPHEDDAAAATEGRGDRQVGAPPNPRRPPDPVRDRDRRPDPEADPDANSDASPGDARALNAGLNPRLDLDLDLVHHLHRLSRHLLRPPQPPRLGRRPRRRSDPRCLHRSLRCPFRPRRQPGVVEDDRHPVRRHRHGALTLRLSPKNFQNSSAHTTPPSTDGCQWSFPRSTRNPFESKKRQGATLFASTSMMPVSFFQSAGAIQ